MIALRWRTVAIGQRAPVEVRLELGERNNFLNAQDAVAAFRNPDDVNLVEQVTDYHRPHIWVLSGMYELPFGNGRKFAANASGLAGHLIGGWQAN